MNDGKVTIRVTLDSTELRLLASVLLLLSLTGSVSLVHGGTVMAASSTYAPLLQGGSGQSYYLTASTATGANADTACASGYHMASLWEILDVSNLAYDTTLGYQHPSGDQGDGPPTGVDGWVRTGGAPSIGGTPGGGNCAAWSSSFSGYTGTVASLPTNWSNPDSIVGVWEAGVANCSSSQYVWCTED